MVAVAEITKVDEITLVTGKNSIAVLQVPMDGSVFVRSIGDEPGQFIFFRLCKERILLEQTEIPVLHVLELGDIHVGGMQLQAHPGEFLGIPAHVFRVVSCCT